MQIKKFESGTETDTVVISPYPLKGSDTNTGPRYQEDARLSGFDILGATRDGSDTTRRNEPLREMLDPENPAFDRFWGYQVEDLDHAISPYDKVIVRGQSVGSFPALALVKNGLRATHLLVEDGINLRYHRTAPSRLYSWYAWSSAQFSAAVAMPKPPEKDWAIPKHESDPARLRMRKMLTDIHHSSPLWRSSYGHDALLDIVRYRPQLPVLCKFLGNSVISTPRLVELFSQEFAKAVAAREQAGIAAEAHLDYDENGWHGYLLFPQYTAPNLAKVGQMASYVGIA